MRCAYWLSLIFLIALSLDAQTLRPLHVSTGGIILDDSGKPVRLRGLNRSATGYGNADANATDAEYAAQNQLLSMNLVRIFVNAAWYTGNVQVPIANQKYQDYIDALIQRAKKYGNYALIVKAGQFPDPPCGADGKNCPAANQGDLNCKANASLCPAQDTTGAYTDTAFSFWGAFAKKYAGDPAVLYDTWEDMHGIDPGTWSDGQNQLIATIRDYNPQALIFVEDTGTAFEMIATGALPDLAWSNIVWNFHIYNVSTAACPEPASPRYANWPQNIDPLVSYAQQSGHAVAITEWGGCNDSDPYHTNLANYARLHSIALSYFDSGSLIAQSGSSFQLTSTGSRVAQAYTAIATAVTAPAPVITGVVNAEGGSKTIAANTWLEIDGSNLAPAGDTRVWAGYDFIGGQLPAQIDTVSVTVNGNPAYVYYASPTQVNVLSPLNPILGTVQVKVTNAGVTSAPFSASAQPLSPSFFVFNGGPYVAAEHASGAFVGPTSLYPGYTTPIKPGEIVVLYGNGFGPTVTPPPGSTLQTPTLVPAPVFKIGNATASLSFAGLVGNGLFQFNVVVPASTPDGDQPITATQNGVATQAGTLITVQH